MLGTPAEEGGCGKGYLIDAGALDAVDAAMMAHPTGSLDKELDIVTEVPMLALVS